jgi:hypothetical protein
MEIEFVVFVYYAVIRVVCIHKGWRMEVGWRIKVEDLICCEPASLSGAESLIPSFYLNHVPF